MSVTSKLRTAVGMFRTGGLTGLCRAARQNLVPPVPISSDALFRYATCDDLICLKAKYPEYCFGDPIASASEGWGLKQMGTLFCVSKINDYSHFEFQRDG